MTARVLTVVAAPQTCPTCQEEFDPKRRDQRYCGRACQKNSTRPVRTVADSLTERRRSEEHYGRALWLAHDLYTMPPSMRLGFMSDLVAAARDSDAKLRNILTDPKLLGASPDSKGLFFRRCPSSYRTIAQAADIYCRKFWRHGVAKVVHGRCPEPETGEVDVTPQSASTPIRGNPLGQIKAAA